MARPWKNRKDFSHNFKSPVGNQRRPAWPMCGDSEAPDRSEEWEWDSGDRLKGTLWPHRGCHRLLDWGRRQTLLDRPGWQWQRWWKRACILHGKQNWVTGLAWGIILVQRVKPNRLLQRDMGCDVELATQLLLFQERQSCLSALGKRGKNLGGEQGEPSRFSFHFLSFPFVHEPLCLASWKAELSPINGDSRVLSAWATPPCTERARRAWGVSPDG